MIVDAATPQRRVFGATFDTCVIGSGPAGITLARALAAKGFRVALMEGGEFEWSPDSQALYEGEVVGEDYPLDSSRLRYFGGTSNHWSGVCRHLTAEDMAPRPQNPGSGWPIGVADLARYCDEADRILDVRPEPVTPVPAGATDDEPFEPDTFMRSAPTRFRDKYHDEIAASERIVLGLRANLIDLRLSEGLGQVAEARFRSYAPDDPGFVVQARVFCLCAGGIENARLLLNFRSQMSAGVGNQHDLVGRYFNEHPSLVLGEVIFENGPTEGRRYYRPSEAFMAEHGTLAMSLRVTPLFRRRASLIKEGLRTVQCTAPFAERLLAAVGVEPARCDTGGLQDYWYSRDPDRFPFGRVSSNAEQALDRDSRVMLADERDALGLQRVRLDWRLNEIDHRTYRTTTFALAGWVADRGIARMRVYDWLLADPPALPPEEANLGNVAARHHMCTTRMSPDPRQGVVDTDCRVHGLSNLYIGGSSVFPDGAGYSNPTYTIVQLALRLADHLHDAIRS